MHRMACSRTRAGATALLLALAVLAVPGAYGQRATVHRVGQLNLGSAGGEVQPYFDTFVAAMRKLGYVEGRNFILDRRWADGSAERLGPLVDELIALKPHVLLGNEAIAQIMRAKTTSIPIVLTSSIDPVKAGLARTLSRPGMNVTGITQLNDQLPAKHIELMRDINPRLSRVAQLVDISASGCRIVEEQARLAAGRFGVTLVPYYVTTERDLEQAFARMEQDRPDVVLPCPSSLLFYHRALLFENVRRLRIPMTSFIVANVPDGVLFAYATSLHENLAKAATYVDKILKGASPSDLPIEQPTNFELVLNLKTAKALNLTIPRSILVRAERVIE